MNTQKESSELPKTEEYAVKYEPLGVYRSAVALAFVIVAIWYLHWRIPTLSAEAPIFSGLLYGAEVYGFLSALLHLMMTWRLTIRESPPCTEGLSVDVFVLTYNESVDLVRKTLLAAKHMDYPHETWLLDDGNRQEMKSLAEHLEIRYLARAQNLYAKAGNLNNAMAHSNGDFVAIFDADHAPQRNFLTQTLGYFSDASVAFVQTPQDYFNLDSYQHRLRQKKKSLWTEQALFFKVIQRGKDYWNSAFFCGSCGIVRRAALDRIGGFAIETVTEDLHTSIKFHQAGFRSIYHAEPLAFGIAPANVAPFLKQRVRWGQGAMQVLKAEKLLLFNGRLTLAQRLNYLASIMTYFDGWQKGIYYLSPAIVLLTGIMPIEAGAVDFLIHFLPFYFLSFIMFEEVGRGYGGTFYIAQYNFARFAAFVWATLGLFVHKLRFRVTSKVRDKRSTTGRLFLPQMAILLLNTGAVPFGFIMARESNVQYLHWIYFNIFWATVNAVVAMIMLNYTQKVQKFLRDEYRFPVPLPVEVQFGDERTHGTIDNISVTGCSIYGSLPDFARKGHMLRGEVFLPSGPLPFEAQITNEITAHDRDQVYLKAVGCHFIWNRLESREALELFLYGTDLQWKLLGIRENAPTPLQWLKRWLTGGAHPLRAKPDEHWATCKIVHDTADLQPLRFGLIPLASDETMPRQLVTFLPLPIHSGIRVQAFTRTRQIEMLTKVGLGDYLENSAGPIYLYPIEECQIIGMQNWGRRKNTGSVVLEERRTMHPALRPAMRTALLAAVLVYLFVISANLAAAEQPSRVFVGNEVSGDNSYAYFGHVAALPESWFGYGYVRRLWLDRSTYTYAKGAQTYDVSAPGAQLSLGYLRERQNHWWAAYAGLSYRRTSISPDDPENEARGGMLRPIFQAEGERTLAQTWRIGGGGSYIAGPQAYWVRGRLLRDAWSRLQVGLEAIAQGDPNYSANQFGVLLLGLRAGGNVSIGLKAGKRQVQGLDTKNYFGIELGGMY